MNVLGILNRPLVIRTNYGDESISMMQWVYEAGLTAIVVYIDTGWAAENWTQRIELGETFAKNCGFQVKHIVSQISFSDAVMGRGAFPSAKFQWCTALLKGLPFLDWLETIDLRGEAIILIAKRKAAALAHTHLEEWIERCEFHNDRTVWHPILNVDTEERDALLKRAGFKPLNHRSLECEPCINSTSADWERLNALDKKKLYVLELEIKSALEKNLKGKGIEEKYLDLFYRGCGNHFGCGL